MTNADALRIAMRVLADCGFGQAVYGGFHGGDPRDFTPDPECSTEKERENHRLACAAWDRGERPEYRDKCGFQKMVRGEIDGYAADGTPYVVSELGGNFGLGTTQSAEESAVLAQLSAMLHRERNPDTAKGEGA